MDVDERTKNMCKIILLIALVGLGFNTLTKLLSGDFFEEQTIRTALDDYKRLNSRYIRIVNSDEEWCDYNLSRYLRAREDATRSFGFDTQDKIAEYIEIEGLGDNSIWLDTHGISRETFRPVERDVSEICS